jgi:inositol-hexakisphosphate 5-kinase
VGNLPEDLTPVMELALPSSPPHSSLSLRSLLSPTRSRFSQAVNNVGPQKLTNPSTKSTKGIEESGGTIRTVRRIASEGQSGKKILQLRVRDQNQNRPFPLGRSAVGGEGKMLDVGNDSEEKSEVAQESNRAPRERGSAMRETLRQTGSKERSASRGRTHVDKSIEATLPNREPAKNVRTRKSSHLMGIFKETTSVDQKRRDGQSRTALAKRDEGAGRSTLPVDESVASQPGSQSGFYEASAPLFEEPSRQKTGGLEIADRPSSVGFDDLPINAEPSISAILSDTSTGSISTPASPSKTEHDPYFRKRDEIKQSLSSKRPAIPAKLLEDIRKRQNLTPAGDREATISQSLPSLVDVPSSEEPASARTIRSEEAENHHEEDEEHISSAVYFPHPGPSDEDIEHFTSPDEEQKAESFPAPPIPASPTVKAEVKRTLSDVAPAEHIDISVRSKHEERVFHGDYRPAEEQSDDILDRKSVGAISDTALENAYSAPESEISSGEELSDLSQAEGEVTPTSTPVPPNPLPKRERASTAAAPKGAVVLEPYSHQVGGHSTMFRFSRRAVCKQLNNRENEFYERIEQRHPDMLRFLPRLVTPFYSRVKEHIHRAERSFFMFH